MINLTLPYAILSPTIVGVLFVSCFSRHDAEHNIYEKLFLGYGTGVGFFTFGPFIVGLLRIPFSLAASKTASLLLSFMTGLFLDSPNRRFKETIILQKKSK
jgi:hypothetical protein